MPKAKPGAISLPFCHVNVFTPVPFAGNPAGVICGSRAFRDEEMLLLAREIGLPGNGFIWPADTRPGEFHARFFTPVREVSLSGHTALACSHVILAELEAGASLSSVTLLTRTSRLTVVREEGKLWLTMPLPTLRDFPRSRGEAAEVLDLKPSALREGLPLQLTPENDLLIPLAEVDTVLRITPNSAAVADFGKRVGVRGLFPFGLESREDEVRTYSRFFAPHFGIPEDIATGSVHGPLMIYLWRNGLIEAHDGQAAFVGRQGEALGRGSRLYVDLQVTEQAPQRVRVGGEVVTVLKGAITPPTT